MVLGTITILLNTETGEITAVSAVSMDWANQDIKGVIGQAADALVVELNDLQG